MHEAISYRSISIVSANGVKHVQWNLYNVSGHRRECCSAHLIQSFFLLHTGFDRKCHMRQTCQLSQFCRESHDFLTFLTVSRQDSQSHGFLGNILNWNITLLNKNINFVGKFLCLDKLWLFQPWSCLSPKKWLCCMFRHSDNLFSGLFKSSKKKRHLICYIRDHTKARLY